MTIDNILLNRIANHCLFYGSFNSDLGLYNGKMGMVIFFFHYARYTGNTLYENFAEEFLNEILDSLHNGTLISFKRGLSGIGWGILYLIKQGFMETDIQETFKDIDDKIMEYNLLNMKDQSLETGAKGVATYAHNRLSVSLQGELPFMEDYRLILHKTYPDIYSEQEILKEIVQHGVEINPLSWKVGLRILLIDNNISSYMTNLIKR